MDKKALHGHIWTTQGLTTCTHSGASLTTGGSPTGLTRFACLAPLALSYFSLSGEYRGLAPLLPDGEGLELWGKLRPTRQGMPGGGFPLDRSGRSRGHRNGGHTPPGTCSSRVHGTGPPFPRPGLLASGWRFGRNPL